MSEKTRQHLSHDVIFHGVKAVSNESAQITGINKIGYIQVKSNTHTLYIGATGVSDNGFPLTTDGELIMTAASLEKLFVSGSGNLAFIGAYSN